MYGTIFFNEGWRVIRQEEKQKAAAKFRELSSGFIALGDETRQHIVLMLAEAGFDGMNVSDITTRTHLSRPAISHHLKILRDAGIISSYKRGTQVFYYIYIAEKLVVMKELIGLLEVIIAQSEDHAPGSDSTPHP